MYMYEFIHAVCTSESGRVSQSCVASIIEEKECVALSQNIVRPSSLRVHAKDLDISPELHLPAIIRQRLAAAGRTSIRHVKVRTPMHHIYTRPNDPIKKMRQWFVVH